MTHQTNFDRVSSWLKIAGKEQNNKNLSTQVGVHLEEVAEMLDAMNITSPTGAIGNVLIEAKMILQLVATGLKSGEFGVQIFDHEAMLDALCDQDVTLNGVAYLAGYDKNRADKAVLDSNDSKFDNGKAVILPGGKIGKSASYVRADLSDCIPQTNQESAA